MTSFQEFLKKKAEEQRDVPARERREEWVASLDRLWDQVVAWLKEDDPEGFLAISRGTTSLTERGLGTYDAPTLDISVGGSEVSMRPIARNVVGSVDLPGRAPRRADGCVDIADRSTRYRIYRIVEDGREAWYAVGERHKVSPLDKARLEEILQDLLS